MKSISHQFLVIGLTALALFGAGFLVLAPARAEGAVAPELYFRTTANSFSRGSSFTVGVFVNASESVNAFDVEIGYSVQSLEFLGFNTADSIMNLRRGEPEVLSAGIVRIEGGSLPAFSGRAGELMKLNFRVRPEASGTLQWSFRKGNIFLSDGKGTLREARVAPLVLPISSGPGVTDLTAVTDRGAPVFFTAEAAKNPVDNGYFAVWIARDDDSGIRDSRIRTRRWFFFEPWETAVNPVKLASGVWEFELKVSDNQGNSAYRTVVLWPVLSVKLAEALAAAIAVAAVFYILRRRNARRRTA